MNAQNNQQVLTGQRNSADNRTEMPPQPKRRRIIQPVFRTALFRNVRSRSVLTGLVLVLTTGLWAQAPTTPSTNPTGQQPQSQQAVEPQQGWVLFDDNVGAELRIPPEQLQQLRAVDERYMSEYRTLGTQPTADPRYRDLTDRRDAELRQLMDPTMYGSWSTKFQPVPNTVQEQRGGGISTPVPPRN